MHQLNVIKMTVTLKNYKLIAEEPEAKRIENVLPFLIEIQFQRYGDHFKDHTSEGREFLKRSQVYFSFLNKKDWTDEFSLVNIRFGNAFRLIDELSMLKNDLLICFFPKGTKKIEIKRAYRFIKAQLLKKGMVVELIHQQPKEKESAFVSTTGTEPLISIRRMAAEDIQMFNIDKYDIFRRIFFLRYYLKRMDLFTESGTTQYLYVASTQLSQLYIRLSLFLLGFIFFILMLMSINYKV